MPSLRVQVRWRDLRSSMGGLLLAVALLLAALIGYSAFHDAERSRAQVQADALRYSREAALGIDGFLSSTHQMLSALAATPAMRDQQPEAATATLAELLRANPQYANIWATRSDGWNYASPLPPPGGTHIYIGDRRYFQDALRTGGVSIESIPDNRQHPTRFAVALSIPVLGADGKANGTVQAAFELLPVQEVLRSIDLPAGSTVTVLDESGYVVARHPSPEQWVGRKAEDTPLWRAIQDRQAGVFEGEFLDGESSLAGYTASSLAPWKVVAGFPPEAANAAVWEGMWREGLILTLPGLVLVYLAWRLARSSIERAKANEVIRSQQAELRSVLAAVFDTSPAALAIVAGPELVIRYGNRSYRSMTPHPEVDPVGRRLIDVWPPEKGYEDTTISYQVMESRRPLSRDHHVVHYLGRETRHFSLHVSPLSWDGERANLLVAWETTALEEARTQAEAAVKVRDEFISIAAHELKTPITTLRGFAQVTTRQLRRTGSVDSARLALAMEKMDQQTGRLARLVEQFLSFSSLEADGLALHVKDHDLGSLVDAAVASARELHPTRTFHYRSAGEAMAPVDALRMEQVITNLLDNAVRFSPRESPVEISLERPKPGWIDIAVRDFGEGVPEEIRERIFERFYQAHGERHTGGLGLGLYISRAIARMHGGSLYYEEVEGGGSRFVVRLPIADNGRQNAEVGAASD